MKSPVDAPAREAVRSAQERMRRLGWSGLSRDPLVMALIVNEKGNVAWDLLIETRRSVRQMRDPRGPLKTGRHAPRFR